MKKSLTIKVSDEERDLILIHKALLRCEKWDQYAEMLAHFPRHQGTHDYEVPEDSKSLTIRFDDKEFFKYLNAIRRSHRKTWRTFILEAVYGDEIPVLLQQFRRNSKIILNVDEVMQ